jgi:thiol-disulfide isomerase/thioredoxin
VKLHPTRTVPAILACVLSVTLALVLTGRAQVAEPKPKPAQDDPKARQLLDDMAKAYQNLKTYSDQGEFVLSATVNGKNEALRSPLKLSFVRPNKLRLDAGQVLVVSDGTTLSTSIAPLKKYTAAPAPKAISFETFRQGPLGSILFGGPSAPPMFILLNLLVGDDPAKSIGELGGAMTIGADQESGGTPCKALVIDQEKGPDIRLLVDPGSKLLKSVDLVFDPKDLAEKGLQDKVAIERLGWSSGTVATKDVPADVFTYEPVKGFAKVESFAQAQGGGEEKYPVNELVGKPAPDFTLTVLDGAGKTKTLSKGDLAGKVVLLDFWATWCGPCLMELPEVQKLVEAYAKDKKDVRIVALSQDDQPNELAEVRKLVEKTLDEKKIKLTGTSVGLVGLDPSRSVGEAFQVNAYPTVVLLDGKGIVQAAHVGIPNGDLGEVGPTLTKAIDTLLEGKSLAPKPEEAAAGEPGKAKN